MNGVLQQAEQTNRPNPALTQIAEQAEQQVPDKLQREFLSVMAVGGKLIWSDEMTKERRAFDQALRQVGDIPTVVAHAVIKTISIIQQQSKRKKPLESVGLAAPIFMSHILQYVEAKHGLPVTNDVIDETGKLVQVNLLRLYGVTEPHIQELLKSQSGDQARGAPEALRSETEEEAPRAEDNGQEEE